MSGQGVLDLGAVDVLASPVDHVVAPIEQLDRAVAGDPGDVAGVEPAAGQGPRRRLRAVPVTRHELRAAHQELACPVRSRRGERDVRRWHREADLVGVAEGVVVRQPADDAAGLGEAIAGAELRRGERLH
jgi:hypothetical protein